MAAKRSHHGGKEIAEGIAKATLPLLLEAAQQCKTSLAFNVLVSAKPDFNSSITYQAAAYISHEGLVSGGRRGMLLAYRTSTRRHRA